MIRFEVGKQYEMRSPCVHECIWKYTVVSRTEMMISLKDEKGQVKRFKVKDGLSKMDGRECLKPLGQYSMSPTLRA